MSTSTTRRLLAGAAICVATMAALPAVAWAHVEAEGEAQSGGATQVTFSFTHGCKESPTTSLRIQLPAGTTDVKAEDPTGWTSTVTATELNWTGGSIPNGTKGEFVVTMKLTGKEGDTVFFPTIQGCPGGQEEAWIDKSEDPEAETAAPRITLGAEPAGGGDHDKAGGETGTTAKPVTTEPASSTSSSSNTPLIIGAVFVMLLILGGGGYALSKRGSSST